MGFLVAFNRKMYLTNYIHRLQTEINERTQAKLYYTEQIMNYNKQISDIGSPDSPAVKKLEGYKNDLELMEQKIDMEIQKFQTQLQAANTEIQSADQMLQAETERSFSYKAA